MQDHSRNDVEPKRGQGSPIKSDLDCLSTQSMPVGNYMLNMFGKQRIRTGFVAMLIMVVVVVVLMLVGLLLGNVYYE